MNPEKIQPKVLQIFKYAVIASPFVSFALYLNIRHKIMLPELLLLLATVLLPLAYMMRYFGKRVDHLARQTMLQIHDNRATRDSQLLLMGIMEKISDPLLILDSGNHILMANESAHQLLGERILKQDITVFIRNDNLARAITDVYENGASASCEFNMGYPLVTYYLARIHRFDLTDNQAGAKRLNMLAEKQYIFLSLYDISAMKRADRMRADFVANASHELRTPLSSLLGFIETLQGPAQDDAPARARFLKIMFDEASRMSRLIEDLLSLSRIERDEHIPPAQKVRLCPLIESVIEVLMPQATAARMKIRFSCTALSTITGDHDQLTQVFQNLIENAIKYGRKDTEVLVTCTETSDFQSSTPKAKEMTITIVNEGPGIPAQHLPRLMERFYRVDSARSRSLGGTGLGLAIVKHIIQRHKGRISFESVINKTTTVTVNLPA